MQCSYAVIKNISSKIVRKGLVQVLNSRSSKVGFVQFSMSNDTREIGTYFMKRKKALDIEFSKFLTKIKTSQKAKNKYLQ